jgi:hypothetical protein
MNEIELNSMLKKDLIKKFMELEDYSKRQETQLRVTEREKREAIEAKANYIKDIDRLNAANAKVTLLEKALKDMQTKENERLIREQNRPDVLQETINKQLEIIQDQGGYITELMAISNDFFAGMKALINLSENNYKKVVEEINKKYKRKDQ